MTNREWLQTLSDEDFIEEYPMACGGCPARDICDNNMLPRGAVLKAWLRRAHKERQKNDYGERSKRNTLV